MASQTPSQVPEGPYHLVHLEELNIILFLQKWAVPSSPYYPIYCDESYTNVCVTFWFTCVFPSFEKENHWVKAIKQSAFDKQASMLPLNVEPMDTSPTTIHKRPLSLYHYQHQ